MSKHYLFLLSFAAVVGISYCTPPPHLTKCKSEDTKCITDTTNSFIPYFAAGIPDFNVEPLDPLFIKSINASEGNLLFTLSDVIIVGLKNCKAKKIQRENLNSKLTIKIICSTFLDGQYVLKGSILVLPIEGKGRIHVDFRAAEFTIETVTTDENGPDGKSHWKIKTASHVFDLKEKSHIVFEGLYEGNEILGEAEFNIEAILANEVGADGKSHWQVKDESHTFDLKAKSDVAFDGLYDVFLV